MSKRACWATTLVFLLFIALFFSLNLILPDKSFSEQENRRLQTLPEFSFRELFSGDFTADFEKYCCDQFVLRDRWIELKARLELAQGKASNNNVYLCDGQRLLEPFTMPDTSQLDSRVRAVNGLVENVSVPVTLALIPGASQLYAELFPQGVDNDSQKEFIDYLYGNTTANTADLYAVLEEHKDEPVFYRTDHHWTSLGAYWGYTALVEALGMSPRALEDYNRQTVSQEFQGTTYSASGFFWIEPDSMEIFVDVPEGLRVERYESTQPIEGVLYDESKLSIKDKYSFFLGGNAPRVILNTGREDGQNLLIIRDSYTDCLAPFLLEHFSQIHLLDLRYYRASVAEYVRENEIDQVLVLYGVNTFSTDTDYVLMAW